MSQISRILSVMGQMWSSQQFKDGIFEIWWDFLGSVHDKAASLHLSIW